MTNKLEISRELAAILADEHAPFQQLMAAKARLRELLAAPVVERQDHVAEVEREFDNDCGHVHLLQDLPDGTKLYTSPPAPVAADEYQALLDRHNAWMAGVENGKASLVLPDRKEVDRVLSNGTRIHDAGAIQWNACIDKLKELNK